MCSRWGWRSPCCRRRLVSTPPHSSRRSAPDRTARVSSAAVCPSAAEHGRVAGIVSAAGSILLEPSHMTAADEWHETIARNLTSAFATVRAAGRVMTTGGSVVLVSTVAAAVGLANGTPVPRACVSSGISRVLSPWLPRRVRDEGEARRAVRGRTHPSAANRPAACGCSKSR